MAKKKPTNKKHVNKYKHLSGNSINADLQSPFIPQDLLDYHNKGSLTPYDIEKIYNEFIEDSWAAGYNQIRIITGKGQIVRPLILKLIKKDKRIKKYQTAGYFSGQSGAFDIHLT